MGILSKLLKAADSVSGLEIIPGPDPTAGCTVDSSARVLGIADLPSDHGPGVPHLQMALLRLAVERADGEYEACVRQDIPPHLQATLVPGDVVSVRSHPVERGRVYVMWGNGPDGSSLIERGLLRWPEHDRWPNINALEVYRRGEKRDPHPPQWRSERHAITLSLTASRRTNSKMNGRDVHALTIGTPAGALTLKVQVPDLAFARLMVSDTEPRIGAPVVLLVSDDRREIDIDWEATIAQPENWRGGS